MRHNINSIARTLAELNGKSIKDNTTAVKEVFEVIANNLGKGEAVSIQDFGVFNVKDRVCSVPGTTKKFSKKLVHFKSFEALKELAK